MIRYKKVFSTLLLCGALWIGFRLYSYVCDTTEPVVSIAGVAPDGCYAADLHAAVSTDKNGYLSIWVDNAPLVQDYYLKAAKQHAFSIPTQTLSDGKHCLKVACTDTRYQKNSTETEVPFFVDNRPLQAAFVQDEPLKVLQGRTLHVQFQVNKEVHMAQVRALANTYSCFPESKDGKVYECYIPIDCEEKPNEYLFSVEVVDKVGNNITLDNKFQIVGFPFKKQHLAVDAEKLKEEKEKGRLIAELEHEIAKLSKQSPAKKRWNGTFCTPIEIDRITCEYGTIRTTQERGRYMHKALDVINHPKSVIWAPQDGKVVLKDRFDFSGNTVIVDHGHGLLSLFYHLDDFADIQVGQKVAKGNPLGTLGKTGYATGYHLHWEMRLNNMPVDPMQWTKETF